MTEQSKILVIGATGNVGRELVSGLLGMGAAIRALTRNPFSCHGKPTCCCAVSTKYQNSSSI